MSMRNTVKFLHTNFFLIFVFQRYCRFCAPAGHVFPPTSSLPKFSTCSEGPGVDGWPLGYQIGLIVRAISLQDFQRGWLREIISFSKTAFRPFKVDSGAYRKHVCDFLLVRHSNLGPISHRFGAIAGFLLRN